MNVLVVCAHPDDEVLGCGGTIARHVAEGDKVHVVYVADGETARIMHNRGERNKAAQKACEALGASPQFLDHPDQRLDQLALLDITREIEAVAKAIQPRVVYTHHVGDLNRDHRIVHKAVMTAFRPVSGLTPNQIFAFEVLSSTEWGSGFWPNHFVDISAFMKKKLEALHCYSDEMRPPPHARSYASAIALAEMRGYSVGQGSAEAFMVMRSIR